MPLKTSTSSNGSMPPYWERVEPVEYEFVEDAEVRIFDDREQNAAIQVQFTRQRARRRQTCTFTFATAEEFHALVKDLEAAYKALRP